METKDFANQLDTIIESYDCYSKNVLDKGILGASSQVIIQLITQSRAAIKRISGPNSEYYKTAMEILKGSSSISNQCNLLIGCIRALKLDILRGYLVSMSERIHGDMFSDYLEMAEHLIEEKLKDPAAVIIGATLESHVKKLSEKYEIDLNEPNAKGVLKPKSFDKLNGELCKKEIYNLNNNKQLTAWYGIRTSAAHGKYEDVDLEYLKLMLAGTRMFIEQFPA